MQSIYAFAAKKGMESTKEAHPARVVKGISVVVEHN